MSFDHLHYVPCLRWKQGEYQAVSRLPKEIKQRFTPLIEVPEIGWDFEKKKEAKILDEHLNPIAKRIGQKWGKLACFVDLCHIEPEERMSNGVHPVRFVFDNLRISRCLTIPVTGIARDKAYQQEVKSVIGQDGQGVCLRLSIEQSAHKALKQQIDSVLSLLKIKPHRCDLILDLASPNFLPIEGFATAIMRITQQLPYLTKWRTFTLIGTSFPETMSVIKTGGEIISRNEWQLYKVLVSNSEAERLRLPTFGDYAVSHPKVVELDMRILKPSATIRYTIDDSWYIVKGRNVRDHGFEQYRSLSRVLSNSRYYCGSEYSWGDSFIKECSGGGKTGNLTMWRQVGTNHHITKAIEDIASFYASSNNL